jgi:hypothetical protein
VNDDRRLRLLRARYRSLWQEYKAIARKNARSLLEGRQPSKQQLSDERQAIVAVDRASNDLLAAISRLRQ